MKVSVVIPVYNVGPYIGDAVKSVMSQTLADIEIIVVDDCGTDDSMTVVEKLAIEDQRIRIVRNPHNMGLASTRNHGLDVSKGEYIYFLDGDDMIVPHALQSLYDTAAKDDTDCLVFEADFIYENEELREKFSGNPAKFKGSYEGVMSGKQLYAQWMKVWDWMPSQPRFFYRREFLTDNNIRYIDGMLHEDEIFAFDVLMSAQRVEVIKEPFFIRRFRSSSIMTGGPTKGNVDGCIRILQRVSAEKAACDDQKLCDAMDFYMGKISDNARGKIKAVEGYEPEVSVIIPVYNTAPYTRECIESVISQTMRDFEIIAIDDFSTDDSWDLINDMAKTEPRLNVYRNDANRGQAYTRNRGISMARGRYVYFLDADDLILPETLAELVAIADLEKSDVVAFGHRQFTGDARFMQDASKVLFSYKGMEGTDEGKKIFSRCVLRENLSPSVPTYIIRKSFIDSIGLRFVEGIIHEDIGYIYEMMTRSARTTLVAKAYFLRRFRGGSTVTSMPDRKKFEGYIRSFERSFELDGDTTDPAVLKWRRDVCGRIRQLYLEAGNKAEGYCAAGGEESTRRLFDILSMLSPSKKEAYDILGADLAGKLKEAGEIFICAKGQYANFMIDLSTALDIVIKGLIVMNKQKRSLRGIPLLTVDEIKAEDKDIPVLLTVSHFAKEDYRKAVGDVGFTRIFDIPEGY